MTEPERSEWTLEETRIIRERQASRSRVLGLILVALAVLFFSITLVKVGLWG